MNTVKQKILDQIQTGAVVMRPRWQFMLATIMLILGIAIFTLALIYLSSLVGFLVRSSGAVYGPGFGMQGMIPFLLSMPWKLILLSALFLIGLEIMVRRFAFAYHKPLLVSVIGIILLSVVGTVAVLQTTIHDRVNMRAERGDVPFLGPVYRGYGAAMPRDISLGEVTALLDDGCMLNDRRRGTLRVILPEGISVHVGDTVVVLGAVSNGEVVARGVRVLSNAIIQDGNLPHPPRPDRMPQMQNFQPAY